jgi:hypothetical protein
MLDIVFEHILYLNKCGGSVNTLQCRINQFYIFNLFSCIFLRGHAVA